MRTVTVQVSSLEDAERRFKAAAEGKTEGEFISFSSYQRLSSTLNAKRMEVLQVMMGQGPLAIREIARRVGRDVKAVHGDVQKLLFAGVLDKTDDGRIEFPYDAIHFDFRLKPADAA
jgi:predicted transcriptional regulator